MNKLLNEFECNLSGLIKEITRDINEIKLYAPKSSNGEIEECSYLKVKQAQLDVLRSIQFSFKQHVLEPLKNEDPTKKIFNDVFTILTKCIAACGFVATESDSDVSINGNVVWFELEELAKEYGINVEGIDE